MNAVKIFLLFYMGYVTVCEETYFLCENGKKLSLEKSCGKYSCFSVNNSSKIKLLCSQNGYTAETCPPLISQSVTIKCISPDMQNIPCHEALPVGSTAYFNCKPYYVPTNSTNFYNKVKCMSNGQWDKEIPNCKQDCGKSGVEAVPLILNGWVVRKTAWPWHASLYILEDGTWDFACGGSLISDKVVITAAHCTWQITNPSKNLKVAVGKYFMNFTQRKEYTQIRNVEEIIQQPLYQDYIGNYGSDIALLVLQYPVKFSAFVLPVCINWIMHDITEDNDISKLGVVLGMGITENDTYSKELRSSSLSVIRNEHCVKHHLRDFRKYITYTKFCAGQINGSVVCNGDSGGGLVFQNSSEDSRWFLEGIVSLSPKKPNSFLCNPAYYALFTKVGLYVSWIKNKLIDIQGDNFIFEN